MKTVALALASLAAVACGAPAVEPSGTTSAPSRTGGSRTLFVRSAVEHPDFTVTLPLHRGQSGGDTVWYVIFDSSSGADADALGVNRSQKLENARGSGAVQKVSMAGGEVEFPATVNFSYAARSVVPGPTGFPPDAFQYSARGQDGYSPLIELPDGTIRNAPHVANSTGLSPKVVSIDLAGGTVTLEETPGFQGGKAVRYVSTDSSHPLAAALENVTFAPALDAAPTLGDDGTDSSRTSLAAFVNGQTGAQNPQRQGLNSAVLDGLSPLNVLRWNPGQGRYSPLWDVHAAAWSAAAVASGANTRQTDFGDVLGLASHGLVTSPDGSPFAAAGIVVNCPIVSQE
ncbi:MAG: hypothetical protein HZB56_07230 [Deltaproteobacteria bacterium]|nr:hypothetical protein [Deltaproteobacteria bacterium]